MPALALITVLNTRHTPRERSAKRGAASGFTSDFIVGGELFSDAMGAPGTPEGTYQGMIEHNARTMTEALGGQSQPVVEDATVGLGPGENPVRP